MKESKAFKEAETDELRMQKNWQATYNIVPTRNISRFCCSIHEMQAKECVHVC